MIPGNGILDINKHEKSCNLWGDNGAYGLTSEFKITPNT